MRLIDADELKSKKEYSAERHEWVVSVAAIDWMNTIDAVPVVHGRWVEFWDEARGKRYGCSVCAASVAVPDDYCPHCGARMDGQELL